MRNEAKELAMTEDAYSLAKDFIEEREKALYLGAEVAALKTENARLRGLLKKLVDAIVDESKDDDSWANDVYLSLEEARKELEG